MCLHIYKTFLKNWKKRGDRTENGEKGVIGADVFEMFTNFG